MENLLNKYKNGFRIKNSLSNLYLYLEEIQSSEMDKIYQLGAELNSNNTIWKLIEAEDGYLYIKTSTQIGESFYLTCTENNNIEPRKFTGEDNQKFIVQSRGKDLYMIRTKITKNKYVIELQDKKIGINDKIKQGISKHSSEQQWIFEPIENKTKTVKLKAANPNMETKQEKIVKTVIYKDDELIHTIVYVK